VGRKFGDHHFWGGKIRTPLKEKLGGRRKLEKKLYVGGLHTEGPRELPDVK